MADSLAELDDMTLRVLALMDGTTVAQQRREAIRDYARRARQDPDVAEIVRLWPCKTYRAISAALLGETGQSLGEQPHPAAHCHLGGKPHLGPCTDPEAGTDG
jgi:hypothetical protein